MKLGIDEIVSLIKSFENFHKTKTVFRNSLGRRITYAGKNKQPIERFCQKILVKEESRCWQWIGAKSGIGYGQFAPLSRSNGGKLTSPHRFIMEYLHGEISPDEEVDHICRNHACANPEHLRIVSHKENRSILKKEFCKHGHLLNGDNLHINSQGKRVCKKCRSIIVNRSLKKRMETDMEFRRKRLDYLNARRKSKKS